MKKGVIIKYKLCEYDKIRLFGEDFVKANIKNCKIIINKKIIKIKEYYQKRKRKNRKK